MADGCCVCFDEKGYVGNPLVYCDGSGCNIAVHKACYGIVAVPKGNWYCSKCACQEKSQTIRCELCPSNEGALKRTDSGGWAHVVCALYIPEVEFASVTNMEPIVIRNVPSWKFEKQCYICRQNNEFAKAAAGACMQCNKANCSLSFHVTCAQRTGLLCEEEGNRAHTVNYCGYCREHYPAATRNSKHFIVTESGQQSSVVLVRRSSPAIGNEPPKDETQQQSPHHGGGYELNDVSSRNRDIIANSLNSRKNLNEIDNGLLPSSKDDLLQLALSAAVINTVAAESDAANSTTNLNAVVTVDNKADPILNYGIDTNETNKLADNIGEDDDDDDDDDEDVPLKIVEESNLSLVLISSNTPPDFSSVDGGNPVVARGSPASVVANSTTDDSAAIADVSENISSEPNNNNNNNNKSVAAKGASGNKRTATKKTTAAAANNTTECAAPAEKLGDSPTRRTLNAPHMLGNQLNPTSMMAQQLCDTLAAEVQDHSICDDEDEENGPPGVNAHRKSGGAKLIGPQLYSKILSSASSTTGNGKKKRFTSVASDDSSSKDSSPAAATETLQELLEKQWEPTTSSSSEQSVHFDLASFLNGLRKIHSENQRLEEYIQSMKSQVEYLTEENRKLEETIQTELNSP